MDTSFDLVALLKQQPTTKQSHKIRPTQFVSVAGGVQKRLETNIKNRKSSRLSVFDRIRNITKCDSPKAPNLSDAQQKALHRKQQLEKWKEEKDKKKKEAAAQKKKPFVAGMSQRKTFGPPPPPKPMPSTSGRVTRSQARQNDESKSSNVQTKSFAPSNAAFKPSIFLNTEVPTLAPINKKKASKPKTNITFEPVLPKTLQKETKTIRSTRAKPVANKPVVDNKKKPNEKTKAKIPVKPPPLKQQMFQSSSSSSDLEQPSKLRSKPSLRKSIAKPQEKPAPKAQTSTSQDSACVLQETGSVSSQESQISSQDSQVSSQDSQDASMSQDSRDASMSHDTASMSSQDELSTPRIKVPKSESSSEEKLRSPKAIHCSLTPEQIAEEAKNISPCVTMSRGKDNARKEMKKKLEEGLLDEDNSNMESVNHFRRQLNSEIARITAMCETWDQIFAQTVLPEPIQELVLTAVGQARLLMSQKLQQFAGLVEHCARPTPGTTLVTPADLHGFWDMVFMQVENVDMRFKNLEELRLRDWIEEQKPVAKKVVAKPVAKKVAAKPAGGPSRLRELIAAARKANKVQEAQSENSESEKSEATGSPQAAASPETKTFEAGFFRISSPMKRSPAPGTPSNKVNLLKTVLSSEAKKSVSKNSTSFAMLRASLMSKNVHIDGVSPLMQTPTMTPVNLYATPARSILKQHAPSSKKPDKLKTVLFHDDPSSPTSYTSCERETEETGIEPLPADDKENTDTPNQASSRKSRLVQTYSESFSPASYTSCERETEETGIEPLPADDKENTDTPNQASSRKSRLVQTYSESFSPASYTSCERETEETGIEPLPADDKENTDTPNQASSRKSRLVQTYSESFSPASYTSCERETEETGIEPLPADDKENTNTPKQASSRKSSLASYTSCERETEETGIEPLPADDKENTDTPKQASSRKSRMSRQNAVDQSSPVMTRSRRKSVQTPLVDSENVQKRTTRKSVQTPLAESNVEKKRSTRKKDVQEVETPKRSTRRRKSAVAV
ncbi:disks large-associated protein 5 [Leguminivora glycinivorella]|uniref:disks large-associated protein 5 n=1 Tax=Leguminivora glycinivorella TaxID=1035111 RepID=UPI00200E3A98|nr:disks large-associated protein 5 [Leguminivora glycinivorella]